MDWSIFAQIYVTLLWKVFRCGTSYSAYIVVHSCVLYIRETQTKCVLCLDQHSVTYTCSVGVTALGFQTSDAFDVEEGFVWEPAITAVVAVAGGAVNQLLLWQGDKAASQAEVLALHGTSLEID